MSDITKNDCQSEDDFMAYYSKLSALEARYFIGGDNSGHEYVVPVDRHTEWNAWTELPEDDERGWTEPVYAMRIDGTLTFCAPTLFYGPLPSPLTEGE